MPNKTLYLHIGLPKTGTTAIQNYLNKHRDNLKDYGVLYPKPVVSVGHHTEALLLLREVYRDAKFHWHRQATDAADNYRGGINRIIDDYNRQLFEASSGEKKLIISSEGIFEAFQELNDIEIFPKYFSEFTIKVIFYIRRIDTMVCSAIMEHIKVHEPISDDVINRNLEFRKKQQLQIFERLQKWESFVGRENIIIRPFEISQLEGGDAVSDFLKTIDLKPIATEDMSHQENVGISIECAYFMAETLTYPAWERTPIEAEMGAIILASKKLKTLSRYKYSLLSPEKSVSLLRSLDSTYKEIAIRYLGRDDGRLFYDNEPKINDDWKPFDGLTVNDVRLIFEEIIQEIYSRLTKLRSEERCRSAETGVLLQNSEVDIAQQFAPKWYVTMPQLMKIARLFIFNNKEFMRRLKSRFSK